MDWVNNDVWNEFLDMSGKRIVSDKGLPRTVEGGEELEKRLAVPGIPATYELWQQSWAPIKPLKGTHHPAKKKLQNVKWLVFSATQHQRERELVVRHQKINRKDLKSGGLLYIAVADLNGDGVPGIFAHMLIHGSCGNFGCYTNAYRTKGRGLAYLLPVEGLTLWLGDGDVKDQKVIGILPSTTNGWHDIVIVMDDQETVWKWDAKTKLYAVDVNEGY